MNFQRLILTLEEYWSEYGCAIQQPYDIEVGAGTMNPETFLKVLDRRPWKVAYVEPSRRPADGRYGENPQRVYKHYQYQVVVKPSPSDIQERYLDSLRAVGIDLRNHDVRFEEDNWEAPTLGAWGVGWQVMLDGTEITQFTYFQQCGGVDLPSIPVEITYGLERICMFLNDVENLFDLRWNDEVSYGQVRLREEIEFSRYSFDVADSDLHFRLFDLYEAEANRLLEQDLVLPAYDYCLRCSHTFNVLESRGAISVTERVGYIARVRELACRCASSYVESLEDGKVEASS